MEEDEALLFESYNRIGAAQKLIREGLTEEAIAHLEPLREALSEYLSSIPR